MTIKKYIFNLISADLKENQKLLINYEKHESKDVSGDNFWTKRVNATKNKIELAKKALQSKILN